MLADQQLKKNKTGLKVLKIFLIVVGCILAILFAGYIFIKHYLGFDIFKFKQALDLINKPYNRSKVITNEYDSDNIVNGFLKLYGENEIYSLQDGDYVFNKDLYLESQLNEDASLAEKEFAGILNLYILNFGGETAEELGENVALKQVVFSSLLEDEQSYCLDITYTFEIKLVNEKEDDGIESFLAGFIPKNILITSQTKLMLSKLDCYDFTFSSNLFKINDLSVAETKTILDTFKNLKIFDSSNEFISSVDSIFYSALFGNEGIQDFISSLGAVSFEFVEQEGQIMFNLKKV